MSSPSLDDFGGDRVAQRARARFREPRPRAFRLAPCRRARASVLRLGGERGRSAAGKASSRACERVGAVEATGSASDRHPAIGLQQRQHRRGDRGHVVGDRLLAADRLRAQADMVGGAKALGGEFERGLRDVLRDVAVGNRHDAPASPARTCRRRRLTEYWPAAGALATASAARRRRVDDAEVARPGAVGRERASSVHGAAAGTICASPARRSRRHSRRRGCRADATCRRRRYRAPAAPRAARRRRARKQIAERGAPTPAGAARDRLAVERHRRRRAAPASGADQTARARRRRPRCSLAAAGRGGAARRRWRGSRR